MSQDPDIMDLEPDPHVLKIYREHHYPMNKLPHAIRMRVEQELDIVTPADPGAADGGRYCSNVQSGNTHP